jgi:hypothetical protein
MTRRTRCVLILPLPDDQRIDRTEPQRHDPGREGDGTAVTIPPLIRP